MPVIVLKCTRCKHEWAQRGTTKPATCPNVKCRSPYWDRKRVRKVRSLEGVSASVETKQEK